MKSALEVCRDFSSCPVDLKLLAFKDFARFMTSRKTKEEEFLTHSSYDTIRTSLSHLHRSAGIDIPDEFTQKMGTMLAGLRRTVAKSKQEKGLSLEEGKSPMSFSVYKKVCEILMKSDID